MPRLPLIFLIAALTSAQDTTIRVSTRLVEVNVVVRDSHGPVPGLTKSDFKIFDKGKEQPIALFNASSASPKSTAAKPQAPIPAGVFTNRLKSRNDAPVSATVLLIDALNTEIPDQRTAQQQILKFLESLDPNRRVAIYILSRNLRVLQDFTDDPALLKKAIAGFHGESSGILDGARDEMTAGGGGRGGAAKLAAEAFAELRDSSNVDRVRLTLAAMEQIANHLAQVPGRKSLIWISSSFPSYLIHVHSNPLDSNRENRTFQQEITRASLALSAADIAIYPVDDRGLLARPDVDIRRRGGRNGSSFASHNGQVGSMADDAPEGLDSMRELADGTGGVASYNTNDINGAIAKAMSDADASYTLAFYADSSATDGFHEIKVKVDRPGLDIRHRKGYLAEIRKQPTENDVATILRDTAASPLDSTAIGLIAAMDSSRLALRVNFDDLSLEKRNGKWTGGVDIAYLSQSGDGHTLASATKKITFDLNDGAYAAHRRDGLLLEQIIEPRKDLARVRIVILDERSGATGSLSVAPRK